MLQQLNSLYSRISIGDFLESLDVLSTSSQNIVFCHIFSPSDELITKVLFSHLPQISLIYLFLLYQGGRVEK